MDEVVLVCIRRFGRTERSQQHRGGQFCRLSTSRSPLYEVPSRLSLDMDLLSPSPCFGDAHTYVRHELVDALRGARMANESSAQIVLVVVPHALKAWFPKSRE